MVRDLRALTEAAALAEVAATAERLAARPFDLGVLPLFRLEVLRLEDERTALVMVMHHIIADEWSILVVIGELSELYQAAREGRPA